MAQSPIHHLLDKLNEMIDARVEAASNGSVEKMEDYRFLVGQIRGLKTAVAEIEALLKKYEFEDED